jgi:hypothetical protein
VKQDTPYGYCHCGCGQKTSIAEFDRPEYGWVEGQPRRFKVGHSGAIPLREKLAARTGPADKNGCLLWQGWVSNSGYGTLSHRGKARCAHRWAYIERHGDILPDDIQLHHTCENKVCVNPDHLEPVDPKTHSRLHQNNECVHGHLLDEKNTYWHKGVHRQCRTCAREYQRQLRAKRRAKVEPKACEVCGSEYTPKKSDQRYCGPDCAHIGYARSKREAKAA